jgi:hypothetical protein
MGFSGTRYIVQKAKMVVIAFTAILAPNIWRHCICADYSREGNLSV